MRSVRVSFVVALFATASLLVTMPSAEGAAGPHRDARIKATASSQAFRLTRVGGLVYFSALDATHGIEPWRTDGTPGGTRMLANISDGSFSSYPTGFAGPGPLTIFGAQDTDGHHLWRTAGSAASTHKLADVYATQFLTVGNVTYFSGQDAGNDTELWKTNGTPGGNMRIKNINPTASSNPVRLHRVGNQVFFGADDGTHGFELWKTNGTPTGTKLVKDINHAGAALPSGDFWDNSVAVVGNTLFFAADDGTHGFELWKSNGTPAGTKLVKDLRHGSDSGSPTQFAVLGNQLFFAGPDPFGSVLWRSDGTNNGTRVVKRTSSSGTSQPALMTAYQGAIYFVGFGGGSSFGDALFRTTGTADSTKKVIDVHFSAMAVAGSTLFLVGSDGHGSELWRSNGTKPGTHLVKDIRFGPSDSGIGNLTALGSKLIFTADDGKHGNEPWRSDGTKNGTIMLKDVNTTHS
jgi:ELWxxDGT repeat protein